MHTRLRGPNKKIGKSMTTFTESYLLLILPLIHSLFFSTIILFFCICFTINTLQRTEALQTQSADEKKDEKRLRNIKSPHRLTSPSAGTV